MLWWQENHNFTASLSSCSRKKKSSCRILSNSFVFDQDVDNNQQSIKSSHLEFQKIGMCREFSKNSVLLHVLYTF